jgi:hypothetical protein
MNEQPNRHRRGWDLSEDLVLLAIHDFWPKTKTGKAMGFGSAAAGVLKRDKRACECRLQRAQQERDLRKKIDAGEISKESLPGYEPPVQTSFVCDLPPATKPKPTMSTPFQRNILERMEQMEGILNRLSKQYL